MKRDVVASKPFVSSKSRKALTVAQTVVLHSELRSQQRAKFEQKRQKRAHFLQEARLKTIARQAAEEATSHTHNATIGRQCLWASKEKLEDHIERPQARDSSRESNKGRFSRLKLLQIYCVHTIFIAGLIATLWDRALKPSHFIAGFKATGVFPFSREAIPARKLAASIPFRSSNPNPTTANPTTVNQVNGPVFISDAKCTGCGCEMTPVRLHVVAYVTKHIQSKQQSKARAKDFRRVNQPFMERF